MDVRSLRQPGNADLDATGRIVAGFDDSPSAGVALAWAAREAVARQCRLQVIACLTVPRGVDHQDVGERQRQLLTEAVVELRTLQRTLRVDQVDTHLDPQDALLGAAIGAELLVVGASTSGAGRRLLFGSVPRAAARHSDCPVVVVRGRDRSTMSHIVVGVDGSSASAAALDWATEEAALHGARLTEVRASSDAAGVLTALSCDADLLVIGSRGRSGFKTLVFGSVALSVVEEAACPVVVVHPRLRSASPKADRVRPTCER